MQDCFSDHHTIATALRSELAKENTKVELYGDYTSFNMKLFKTDVVEHLQKQFWWWIFKFSQKAEEASDKYPTVKKKILHYNKNYFMTKSLRKSIREGWKLRSNYGKKWLTEILQQLSKKVALSPSVKLSLINLIN